MSKDKGYVEFGANEDWWQDDSTTSLLRPSPPGASRSLMATRLPDDTPSLDTSFHDHEMDVGDE